MISVWLFFCCADEADIRRTYLCLACVTRLMILLQVDISHVTYYIPLTLNQSVAFCAMGVYVLPPLVKRELRERERKSGRIA